MKKILGLLGAVVFASSAHSQTIEYEGEPMPIYGSYGTVGPLSGSISLSSPLAMSGTQILDPIAWSFSGSPLLSLSVSNQLLAANNPMGDFSGGTFSITTVSGAITAWDFELIALQGNTANDSSQLFESITSNGDIYSYSSCNGAAACSSVIASNTTPGKLKFTQAPEIDATSAVSALTLLFGGIAMMRGRRVLG